MRLTILGFLLAVFALSSAYADEESGFFNIAHMTNTVEAVEYALASGANAIEIDLQFAGDQPEAFQHSTNITQPCDCSFEFTAKTTTDICGVLKSCRAKTDARTLLNHIAQNKNIALVIIDSKVSSRDKDLEEKGKNAVKLINQELFNKGYRGNLIIGVSKSESFAYLKSAAKQATQYPNKSNYYFSIDQEGNNVPETINLLKTLSPITENRVYGTGITALLPDQHERAIYFASLYYENKDIGTIYTWTIDKESTMKSHIESGVLGIITNKPKTLRDILIQKKISLAKPGSRIPSANVAYQAER
ncbi:hypothetical protein [Marinobacterium arenosum]|uniref:hypothetical protein n=1 Tax=Marinobacterium arenosum TaxID=2862496 RepID=UPI001C957466|nr:hypothetical protein [Marinobacterium arenosum]MBY4675375.1 hypothetical protein [Marinobacterium arenosum]